MSTATEHVRHSLARAGATGQVRTFSEPVATAAAAAQVLGCDVGAIANSLVFDNGGRPLLVVASGAHRVDTNGLAGRMGLGAIRRASPEFVVAHTGQAVGGVAPVGHPDALPTVVDTALGDQPVVWAGGGDELTMFATSFSELVAMTGGTPATVS